MRQDLHIKVPRRKPPQLFFYTRNRAHLCPVRHLSLLRKRHLPGSNLGVNGGPTEDRSVLTTEQISNWTRYDRHPQIFKAVQRVAGDATRILSFGCSTGEEPQTLSELYFPNAHIVGVDISDEALAAAKSRTAHLPNVAIMQSTRQAVSEHGPYDIIFAMSVLCRWPAAKRMDDLSSLYPFANFEERLAELTESLKPEGLLVVHNGSYSLTQSRLIRFFDLILSPRIANPGPVTRFAPAGHKLGNVATDCIFRKRETPWTDAAEVPLRIIHDNGTVLGTIWLSVT